LIVIRIWIGWAVRGVLGLVAAAALLYIADSLVLAYRVRQGTGYDTVQVHQFLATQLKGNKVEYDMIGVGPERCSRSIFPQNGSPACWWLVKHPMQWE
jgi:hypothetical protein